MRSIKWLHSWSVMLLLKSSPKKIPERGEKPCVWTQMQAVQLCRKRWLSWVDLQATGRGIPFRKLILVPVNQASRADWNRWYSRHRKEGEVKAKHHRPWVDACGAPTWCGQQKARQNGIGKEAGTLLPLSLQGSVSWDNLMNGASPVPSSYTSNQLRLLDDN